MPHDRESREVEDRLVALQRQVKALDGRLEFAERRVRAIRSDNFTENFLSGLTDLSTLGFVSSHLDWKHVASPSNPAAGFQRIFADTDNSGHLTSRNSSGTEVDLEYLDADAIAAIEGEATLDLTGDVTIASGKNLTIATDGSTGALLLGASGDVQLFRSSANVMQMGLNDAISLITNLDSIRSVTIERAADSDPRFTIRGGGDLEWGSGSAAADVTLGRGAANRLDLSSGDTLRISSTGALETDIISETTAAAGVTIDGLLIKDGAIVGDSGSTTAILEDDATRTFIGGGLGGQVGIYDSNVAGTRIANFAATLITLDQDVQFDSAATLGMMGSTPGAALFNIGASTTSVTSIFSGVFEHTGTTATIQGFNPTVKHSATGAGAGNLLGFSLAAQANTEKNLTIFTGARYLVQSLTGQTGTIATMTGLDFVWTLVGSKPTTSRCINIPNIGHADITTIEAIKITALTAGTNTYQIREFGTTGLNVFAGRTSVGTTSDPDGVLDVTGGTFAPAVDALGRVARISGTITEAASGTHARMMGLEITAPTITGAGAASTVGATLYISGAPTGPTTNYALWVDADKAQFDGEVEIDGDLNHDGSNIGFYGTAPAAQSAAYTVTNPNADRAYDTNSTSLDEIADVLGTVITDLQAIGLLG